MSKFRISEFLPTCLSKKNFFKFILLKYITSQPQLLLLILLSGTPYLCFPTDPLFSNSQSLFLEPDVFSLNWTGFLQKRLVNDFNDTHLWFLVQETYLLIVSWVCYSKLFSSVHIWIIWRQSSFWILCFQNAKGFQFSKCQSIYNVGRILLLFLIFKAFCLETESKNNVTDFHLVTFIDLFYNANLFMYVSLLTYWIIHSC